MNVSKKFVPTFLISILGYDTLTIEDSRIVSISFFSLDECNFWFGIFCTYTLLQISISLLKLFSCQSVSCNSIYIILIYYF